MRGPMTNISSRLPFNPPNSLVVGGRRINYRIYRDQGKNSLRLEFVDNEGTSFLWDDPFVNEDAALSVVRYIFEKEGVQAFN